MAIPPTQILRRTTLLIFIAVITLNSQTDLDAVRPFHGLGGPGSRASGLGQAFTGIADDVTALFYNPAGLAHLTRREVHLGFNYLGVTTDVSSLSISTSNTITATRLGNAGLALPIPRTKLTVGIGYHQVRAFDRHRVRTFNETIEGTTFTVKERLTEEGSLGVLGLGVGYQVSTQLALGGAVDIFSGKNEYTENDTFSTQSGDNYLDIFNIKPNYIGVGLSLGILMAPIPRWRIGLLLRSPQWIKVDEELVDLYSTAADICEYSTRSSYSARLGSSLSMGPVLLTGDLFWFDYSQIRFKSEIYDSTLIPGRIIHIDIPINDTLRTRYASAVGFAAGAEFLLPGINVKLRGGYRYDPPINRKPLPQVPQHTLALGLSVVPVPQIKIDAAFSLTAWERDLSGGGHEETAARNMAVNFVYRF